MGKVKLAKDQSVTKHNKEHAKKLARMVNERHPSMRVIDNGVKRDAVDIIGFQKVKP